MLKATLFSILIILIVSFHAQSQALYKHMMHNDSFSVYQVIEEAERYFSTNKKGKGSGWKGYQRWKHNTKPFSIW